MGFIVDAWFERTELRLGILDTESNKIILQWSLKRVAETPSHGTPPLQSTCKSLEAHKLFLIACAESLLLPETDRTELNKAP
jgi:hypothetical protein